MAPFHKPKVVLSGLKDRFESLTIQADRLYLGSSNGSLHIYSATEGTDELELVEVKKGLVKRSIDQLGFIKDVNSLVVLSEMTVTLFPLPSLAPPTPLLKAKAAFSFAVHTYIQEVGPPVSPASTSLTGEPVSKRSQPIPSLITLLLVGCRRKAVVYSWKDGEPQDVKEAPLPHSARSIVFLNNNTACFAYSPTEYAIFSIPHMTATEIVTPLPVTASGTAMGALTGLTGYMTLGLGAKAKPGVVQVGESEMLIAKDGLGFFIGADGKPSRPTTIEWPTLPEEISFVNPYIFSVFPAGTMPSHTQAADMPNSPSQSATQAQPSLNQTSLIQIRSSLSLQVAQTLPFPFNAKSSETPVQNAQVRLMTASTGAKSPLYAISTPLDKTAAASEGTSIWRFVIRPWDEQIDELVLKGKYSDGLALLDMLDDAQLLDKDQRRTRIRALNAVSQFRAAKFDEAIDTFIDLDFNPAKVVALYPESVASRLSVPQESWITLYGGPTPLDDEQSSLKTTSEQGHDADTAGADKDPATDKDAAPAQRGHERAAAQILDSMASATGSVSGRLKRTGLAGLGAFLPGGLGRDDDTASISSKKKFTLHDDLNRSIETLVRYLSDRRPKLKAALENVGITPESQSHLASPLSEASVEDLFALPNARLSALTPEQLLRFAQIVDTALYKSYMIIRPALLGSLCRVANWCEVSEVEDDLRARKKYAEMRDLYQGKKMHSKALDLLKELSANEDDIEDKLDPTIQYLQKLGPEYIDHVFNYSRWMFDCDREMAFKVFTSEDVELPRKAVADYLEKIDPKLCAKYLEFIIAERHEESPIFHDRLAELYLNMTLNSKKKGDESTRKEVYRKLLAFIETNDKFGVSRLYGLTTSTDLHEARAILLGKQGRHGQALETYVYRMHDYLKAEEYCKRIYQTTGETSGVFLALLRIYLSPTEQTGADLLQPALDLISRHGPRLDSVETLELLPPLVTTDDVKAFLVDALRVPIFDTRVVKQISKARNDQLSRRLMALQLKRVKVTDSRICPQCHKRLGNSVIAVHSPRGEVTHYQCREPFSRRLNELRR